VKTYMGVKVKTYMVRFEVVLVDDKLNESDQTARGKHAGGGAGSVRIGYWDSGGRAALG